MPALIALLVALGQLPAADAAGKPVPFHREVRVAHLQGEQAFGVAASAPHPDLAPRLVDGQEEREAADVVPVEVGEEEVDLRRRGAAFGLQRPAQGADAGAGVEDEDAVAKRHLDATGVATVGPGVLGAVEIGIDGGLRGEVFGAGFQQQGPRLVAQLGTGQRRSNGAAHAPQAHLHAGCRGRSHVR